MCGTSAYCEARSEFSAGVSGKTLKESGAVPYSEIVANKKKN
jgi:hypothetical protein